MIDAHNFLNIFSYEMLINALLYSVHCTMFLVRVRSESESPPLSGPEIRFVCGYSDYFVKQCTLQYISYNLSCAYLDDILKTFSFTFSAFQPVIPLNS